jgi:hypothetical protein
MYSLVMEQCNFKIKHLFKLFLVINTANGFTVLPVVRHSWGAKRGNDPLWLMRSFSRRRGNSTVTNSSNVQRNYGCNSTRHIAECCLRTVTTSWKCTPKLYRCISTVRVSYQICPSFWRMV